MKITKHQEFIGELADAAVLLFEDGRCAPTAPEIADTWSSGASMPKVLLDEVRARLGEVRRMLHDRGYCVVPVADPYYRLRKKVILKDSQVAECLAVGQGKRQAGILFVREGDLLAKRIKVRHERWIHGSGHGKANAARERIGAALDAGLITEAEALAITDETSPELEAGEDLFDFDEPGADGR